MESDCFIFAVIGVTRSVDCNGRSLFIADVTEDRTEAKVNTPPEVSGDEKPGEFGCRNMGVGSIVVEERVYVQLGGGSTLNVCTQSSVGSVYVNTGA